MQTVSLIPNPRRDSELLATRQVARRLLALGKTVLLEEEFSPYFPDREARPRFVSRAALFEAADLILPLGGDGTILSVAGEAARAKKPVFGINLGTVGFMTSLEKKDLSRVEELFSQPLCHSSRMLLTCRVNGEERLLALNEIVLTPRRGIRMLNVTLATDGRRLSEFRADGLIFNTPTGSTGYAFSAGGAVMDVSLDAIGVKAVSSYLLINSHPMIFCPETVFSLEGLHCEGGDAILCADGREEVLLSPEDRVEIYRSPLRLDLLSLDDRSNLDVFFRKF